LATKANSSDVEAELATKIDISDATVTKQGNTFNGAGQLVQLDSNGKLPAVDGSLLTGIIAPTTTPFAMNSGNVDANGNADLLYAPGSGNVVVNQNIIPASSSTLFGNTSGVLVYGANYADTYTFATPVQTVAGHSASISYYNFYDNSRKADLNLVVNYTDGTSDTICSNYVTSDTHPSFTFNPNGRIIKSVYAGWGYAVSDQGNWGIGQIQISAPIQISVSTATNIFFKVGSSYTNLALTYADKTQETLTNLTSLTGLSTNGTYTILKEKGSNPIAVLSSKVTQGKVFPATPVDGDYHCLTVNDLKTYKYVSGAWGETQYVPLGNCTIADGVITSVATNAYNQNGYDVNYITLNNLTGYRFPAYSKGISKCQSVSYTADCDGWIFAQVRANGIGGYVTINSLEVGRIGTAGSALDCSFFIPVSKGDIYYFYGNGGADVLTFYPAKGAN